MSYKAKYISYYKYIDELLEAKRKFNISDDKFPNPETVILLYTIFLFSDVFKLINEKLYIIDILIINRTYDRILKFIVKNENKNKDDIEKEFDEFIETLSYEIIKFIEVFTKVDTVYVKKITKYYFITEDIVGDIIMSNSQNNTLSFIYEYDHKLLPALLDRYIENYSKYYGDLVETNNDETM